MIKIPSNDISKLDLSNSNLTEFPKEILQLKNLRKLNLSNNEIKHIPKEIEQLNKLELLDLSNNSITNFYSKICSLKKLKVLNLNNNRIKTIPLQISNLESLKNLQIANNKLWDLPSSISELKILEELNLSKNQFEIFPEEIVKISSLKSLWINHLPLKKFPNKEIIKNLTNLRAIYCFGSFLNINDIDPIYLKLTKLKGNSIKELNEPIILKPSKKMNNIKSNDESKILKNKIFISYSHKDKSWLSMVQTNLKVLKHIHHEFDLWDDTRINSGDRWKTEIENALQNSGIAILIISTSFLASDFINNDELPTLLRNAKENGTRILPLIVGHSIFTRHPYLSEFQSVNSPDMPLNSLTESQVEKELVKLTMNISDLLNE